MESRRRDGCRSRSTTFASRSKSRSKRDVLNEGCGKDHVKSKSSNCEGAGAGCRSNRNDTKEEMNERTNDPPVTVDEMLGASKSTDENCRERDESCCREKDALSRRNTFILTDEPTNRCKTEKGHMIESTEVNSKVKISENSFKNSKLDHCSSNSTELSHAPQPSKSRSKISALTTWPDHLSPSSDHLTTSSDYLATSSNHLTTSDESQMSDTRLSSLRVTRINCSNCQSSRKPSDEKKLHSNNNCVTDNMEKIREEVRKSLT